MGDYRGAINNQKSETVSQNRMRKEERLADNLKFIILFQTIYSIIGFENYKYHIKSIKAKKGNLLIICLTGEVDYE